MVSFHKRLLEIVSLVMEFRDSPEVKKMLRRRILRVWANATEEDLKEYVYERWPETKTESHYFKQKMRHVREIKKRNIEKLEKEYFAP